MQEAGFITVVKDPKTKWQPPQKPEAVTMSRLRSFWLNYKNLAGRRGRARQRNNRRSSHCCVCTVSEDEERQLAEEELDVGCRWIVPWPPFRHMDPAEGDEEVGPQRAAAQRTQRTELILSSDLWMF
ncbi:hypothetical protein Q7C36_022158 [Tachysurus vachellii]|uniref:Uncharacterized protein n=1 Tax=Tachysurus vachellii TaxID=175792 RepID=A0AA88IKC1_TACVA|nr:hypothetical protein Q7C36_022158 [Tachysurus vachellii]